jgi:hypothetical protein
MNTRTSFLCHVEAVEKPDLVKRVGFQSWTDETLLVESDHNDILYYTTRWDALCPYISVSDEMLKQVPKPFIVYGLPPDSDYGVPINDRYGLVDTSSPEFWNDERRERKFRLYDRQFRNFTCTEAVIPGARLNYEDICAMGGEHFENCYIDAREIDGFVDYIQNLDVLILRVLDPSGVQVLVDVSILLPGYNQVYGSFCQWNRAYKNRSPGMYACLLACRWAARNGFRYYNLGPVSDYGYKSLFVTDLEPIYSLALTALDHPLALDRTSPLHTDFRKKDWNRIYRNVAPVKKVRTAHKSSAPPLQPALVEALATLSSEGP